MIDEALDLSAKNRRHAWSGAEIAKVVTTIVVAVFSHVVVTFIAEYLWFRTSDLYSEAMHIVRTSPDVESKIGSPVVAGWPLVFRGVYEGVGEVSARLPIHGPRGGATVQLRAKNRGGSWEFQLLEARNGAEWTPVDLMPHPWRPQRLVLHGAGQLYFVGIGKLSRLDVTELAKYYGSKYQLDISLLPPLSYDARRESAEQLIRALRAGYPQLVEDPQTVIIAVTEIGMEWFSWRDDERFAVVSAAGLSPDQFGRQLLKNLGLLWFELPMSSDSRSVLYDDVDGRIDLDLMSDEL
jgi:hypothetical protein